MEQESVAAQKPQTSGLSIVSLVLGILANVGCCLLTGIPAVICGHMALSKIKKSNGTITGSGMALGGLIMGYISMALSFIMVPMMIAIAVPSFVKARDNARENSCHYNMRVIAHAIQQYTIDNNIDSDTDIDLYNDAIMPSTDICDPSLYIPSYLKCPENSATYSSPVNNTNLNVTCPIADPNINHGSFGDLE